MNHLSDELLNEYLDEGLPNRATVEEHLAQCADCAARLAELRALFTEIESLPEITLSRDLAAAVTRTLRQAQDNGLSGFNATNSAAPHWLTLMVGLQAALALIATVIAAPFVIEFASASLPALQTPSLTETFIQLQSQWMMWLDMLSQFEIPSVPEVPVIEVSSLYFLLTLAGVAVFWLVGNGLLLRNQIK